MNPGLFFNGEDEKEDKIFPEKRLGGLKWVLFLINKHVHKFFKAAGHAVQTCPVEEVY